MDFSPGTWGFLAWIFILAMAKWLDEALRTGFVTQEQAYEWIRLIGTVLPCSGCRVHYQMRLHKYNPSRHTVYGFFRYVRRSIQRSTTYRRDPRQHVLPSWIRGLEEGQARPSDPVVLIHDAQAVFRALFVFVYSILFSYGPGGKSHVVAFLNAFGLPLHRSMPGFRLFQTFRRDAKLRTTKRWSRAALFDTVDHAFRSLLPLPSSSMIQRKRKQDILEPHYRYEMIQYFVAEQQQ